MNLLVADGARTTGATPIPTPTMTEGALHESSSVLTSVGSAMRMTRPPVRESST